jgi:hypothetical protein
MTPREQLNCETLRKNFQGREAIYLEKGILRVRVEDIRFDLQAHSIRARVEEIPTCGLRPSLFHHRIFRDGDLVFRCSCGNSSELPAKEVGVRSCPHRKIVSSGPGHPGGPSLDRLLRWDIEAGHLATFSDETWAMGSGGWSLFINPEAVNGAIALASGWPDELDLVDRTKQSLKFLLGHPATPAQRVFCDLAIRLEEEQRLREERQRDHDAREALEARARSRRGCGSRGACPGCQLTYAFDGLWCSHCGLTAS